MANKRIIEQAASTTISNDDWLVKDSPTDGTTKIQASVFKTLMNDGMASDEDLADAIKNIAGEYDSEVEYSKDALCFKDGVLYIANADTTGTWDSTKWDATTIADIIANLRIDANDVVDVKVKGDSLVNSSKIAVLDSLTAQGSVSGSIASFSDGSTHPMSKLEVAIDPIQDLHGYDYPWVGGSGKNKLEPKGYDGLGYNKSVGTTVTLTDTSTTVTVNNNVITYPVGAWGGVGFVSKPLSEGEYYVHLDITGNNRTSLYVLNENNEITYVSNYTTDNQNIANYYGVQNNGRIAVWIGNNSASNISITNPQVESGNLYTTFEPYSNICPISGYTEANVHRTGVNLYDLRTSRYMQGVEKLKVGDTLYIRTDYAIKYKLYIRYSGDSIATEYTIPENETVTIPLNKAVVAVALSEPDANSIISNNKEFTISLAPIDEVIPYNGQTYTVEFKDGSNPLTVYGGSLDVVSGELVVDRMMVVFDGSSDEEWTELSSGLFYLDNALAQIDGTTKESAPICLSNKYKEKNAVARSSRATSVDDFSYFNQTDAFIERLWIKDSNCSTVVEFKTTLTNNPLQVVYPLATPQTYQLTPTQVNSLLGTNNVWADTGDVNEAVYTRDLNTTVNDIISRIEALENA